MESDQARKNREAKVSSENQKRIRDAARARQKTVMLIVGKGVEQFKIGRQVTHPVVDGKRITKKYLTATPVNGILPVYNINE